MIVLLHGVPETAALWDDVREHLDGPSVALQLPGFACARPDGFTATKDAYVDWLLGEFDKIDEPIDLVGHDWGGGLSLRVGMSFPEAVRSWTTDVAGLINPGYVWHDIAQVWQTPGDGEAFFERQNEQTAEERAPVYQLFGLDEKAALKLSQMSADIDGSCILDLYRSATPNPHADWGSDFKKSAKPGLVLTLAGDPFAGGNELSIDAAGVLGAQQITFDTGHFWPLSHPAEGARYINEFIASL